MAMFSCHVYTYVPTISPDRASQWTVLLVLLLVSPPLEPDPPGSVDSQNGPRTQILTQETPIEIRRNNSSICQSYFKKEILDKNGAPYFLRNKSCNLYDTCWV